ncbi:MAG: AAA-like domain-containing protein [Cyanobacteria bacterium P01_G01_bin.54]
MPRYFNTAGPCQADLHYMLPPLARLPELLQMIEQRGYFVIHAPRQTGKTTAMMALARDLTASGSYTAIVLSVESGSAYPHNLDRAQKYILTDWQNTSRIVLPPELQLPKLTEIQAETGIHDLDLRTVLQAWAIASPRPLVTFIDEIDSLEDETLITVLRQLRSGYPHRPEGFPQSLALIGVRDVRDYKVASGGSPRLRTSSPFNIKIESIPLSNFSATDVAALYQQHTKATGQVFEPQALAAVFKLTQGQPWLVNAIARQLVEVLVPDPTVAITTAAVAQAKERIIQRQETHLDSLMKLLREPQVKAILEPMLSGQSWGNIPEDDRQYLIDLGLLVRPPAGGLAIANPIYQETIPRVLASGPQDSLPTIAPTWLTSDGSLDAEQLLHAFLAFWRQHGEPLLQSAPYPEIAPHLVLMAFLHRVVNGGGTLEREYAVGSGRMDLCLRYGAVTIAIEIKVWRGGQADPLSQGLAQLDRYLAGLDLNAGWLVIFDRRPNLPPIAERTITETAMTGTGRSVVVIRG